MTSDDEASGAARRNEPRSFGNGRYVVQQRLGAGNFATVYLAFDERLEVPVAVKLLADHWSWEPEVRGRFVQEARLLRSLNDPHVVQIRDIAETDDGRPYLVMDYATNGTLDQRLVELAHRGDRPSVGELREFVAELAAALGFLHARRIAHRDIKPSNILISRDDAAPVAAASRRADGLLRPGERIVLGDLGLAKDLRQDSGVTVGVGTAGYMAPEQSGPGARIDTRTDIYAASALVSQVATGESPDPLRRYSDGTVASGRPLPAAITGSFRTALEHGLDQDPDRRPQTIEEWHRELDAGLAAQAAPAAGASLPPPVGPAVATPGRSRRRLVTAVAAVALVAAAGTAVVIAAGGDEAGPDATSGDTGSGDSGSDDTVTGDTGSIPATSPPSTAPSTAPATATASTAAATPYVRIVGPTEVPAGETRRWWEVEFLGVVSGTWQLVGEGGVIPLNGDQWAPGDGFQAGLAAGTYTLTLTAFDAVGNPYVHQITFTSV